MGKSIFIKIFSFFAVFVFIFFIVPVNVFAESDNVIWQCVKTNDANLFDCIIPYYVQDSDVTGNLQQSILYKRETKTLAEVKARENSGSSVVTEEKPSDGATGCNPFSGFDVKKCIVSILNEIFIIILNIINLVLAQILILVSYILNFVIYFTIVKFKTNFADLQVGGLGTFLVGSAGGGLVYYLWSMIRDFLNIIIFILIVYSAIRSMFDGFESTRNKFIYLLLFSIVANFSLLFVKVTIDISNILALQAYTLAVKPKGTSSFAEFTQSAAPTAANGALAPKSYGEYIMTATNVGSLRSPDNAGANATDIKNNFMYHFGRMVTNMGLIYILFFMAGMLIVRAGILLYAMIVSPLIAFDLFFKMVGNKSGGEAQNIAQGIRKITNKIRGDFYDALLKGPLLIFFIFLIGVFASSIFSAASINDLSANLSASGVSGLGESFSRTIFIFFKFGIFLALTYILFDQINKFNFAGESGTRMRKFGGKIANYAFGKGLGGASGLVGVLGRNTIGKAASNPNSRLGKLTTTLNNTGEKWKNSEFFLAKRAGQILTRGTNAIQKGSYDPRNTNLLGAKMGGKIRSAIDSATTDLSGDAKAKISLGTAVQKGYTELINERKKSAKETIDKAIKAAGSGLQATAKQIKGASDGIKISGTNLSLSQLQDVVSNKSLFKNLSGGEGSLSDDDKLKIKELGINEDDIKTLVGAAKSDPEILNKIDSAREKSTEAINKMVADEKTKMEEAIKKEVSKSTEEGASVIDKLKRTGSTPGKLLGDILTGNRGEIQEDVVEEYNKEKRQKELEKIKTDSKKAVVFKEIFNDLGREYESLTEIISSEEVNVDKNSAEYLATKENLKDAQMILLEISQNGKSDKEKAELFNSFVKNEEKKKELLRVKKKILEDMKKILDTNPKINDSLEDKIFDLNEAQKKEKNPGAKRKMEQDKRKLSGELRKIKQAVDAVEDVEKSNTLFSEKIETNFGNKK